MELTLHIGISSDNYTDEQWDKFDLNLRPGDRVEWSHSAEDAHIKFIAQFDFAPGFVLLQGDTILAVGGITPTYRNVGSAAMLASTDFVKAPLVLLTKKLMNELDNIMGECEYGRLEARSWSGNKVAHRWLERLGFVREAVMPGHGGKGETYFLYARLRSDHVHNA